MSIGTKEREHCSKLFCFKTIERQEDKSRVISLSEKLEIFRGFGIFKKNNYANTINYRAKCREAFNIYIKYYGVKEVGSPWGATIKNQRFLIVGGIIKALKILLSRRRRGYCI